MKNYYIRVEEKRWEIYKVKADSLQNALEKVQFAYDTNMICFDDPLFGSNPEYFDETAKFEEKDNAANYVDEIGDDYDE